MRRLNFSDEAELKGLKNFWVEDVEGFWGVVDDEIEWDENGMVMYFSAVEKTGTKKAKWSVYLDSNEINSNELENVEYAEDIFHLPWESWQVEEIEEVEE